ncbi:Pkinase-domain-containing protein [Cylindrobasidium torrendii FP15055 ss-10]|uniref:non-specific serine/threonine protein kinase n=1 Tax=Cylindrobasidium torrendii FP15055 ss-10 TaxID=1314674 RepID=A0A0D7BAS1_9AGAR|nr:Pkinase-domain-containing protein [Cylindrobasidium torrendii FP15055 ss-10]
MSFSPPTSFSSRVARHRDPKMVGHWKVGRTIGSGASGRVKLARHAKTGTMAAVKIIPKTVLFSHMSRLNDLEEENERTELALQREIVIMKLIDHPNIMKLYDVYDTSEKLFLILEHVQGGELFDYLCDQGRLSNSEALGYFQQIMSAVDYLHCFSIVHRDLKPENILLDDKKQIRLADFGMAAWEPDRLLETSCGSPHYAAPEVISAIPYDGAPADIWSCGVILFAMLAGRLPFDHHDPDELLQVIMIGEFEMVMDIDPDAQDLLMQMLAKEITMRITMDDIHRHPWFVSRTPKIEDRHPVALYDFSTPLHSRDAIDLEALGHLRTLWPNDSNDEIVASLLSNDRNWQKGLYQLLVAYREKAQRQIAQAESAAREEREQQKFERRTRRADARYQTLAEPMVTPSPSSLPPRASPPTPRRARRGSLSATPSDESLFFTRPGAPRIELQSPSDSERSPVRPPLVVPVHQNSEVQVFFKQVADRIDELYERTESSPTCSPNMTLMQEIMAQTTGQSSTSTLSSIRPLTISRRKKRNGPTARGLDKENEPEVKGFMVVEKPHVRIVEPTKGKLKKRHTITKKKKEKNTTAGITSSSPESKNNWLPQVFRFKNSSVLTLTSEHDMQTTRNECRRLLMAANVSVAELGATGMILKCRLEETGGFGKVGLMKAVKFRVDVSSEGVLVQHEKGSMDSFKEVCKRLQRDWVLDVPGARTPLQVASLPGRGVLVN